MARVEAATGIAQERASRRDSNTFVAVMLISAHTMQHVYSRGFLVILPFMMESLGFGTLAAGIMIGVVGISLDLTGYVQNAAEQSETVKRAMTFLMGGVPMVGYALGSLAFTRFGLSEAEHTRIRSELDARNVDGGGGT